MSTKILNILCEGATEEKFAHKILAPYLKDYGIVVKHRSLTTNKKKNAKGGMLSFNQVERDLRYWAKEISGNNSETHYFTTMFDYYSLPDDFPNYHQAHDIADRYLSVKCLEDGMAESLSFCPNFIPYIQLHEFEALVFCGLDFLKNEYPGNARTIDKLNDALVLVGNNPELVNDKRETAPSRRIISAVECGNKYHYNKPLSGVNVTMAVGIDQLKSRCVHFREWVERLMVI
jgi:hypothetical protein